MLLSGGSLHDSTRRNCYDDSSTVTAAVEESAVAITGAPGYRRSCTVPVTKSPGDDSGMSDPNKRDFLKTTARAAVPMGTASVTAAATQGEIRITSISVPVEGAAGKRAGVITNVTEPNETEPREGSWPFDRRLRSPPV